MDTPKTLSVITRILVESCDVDPSLPLTQETRLAEDLALDSMGMLTLTVELENHYQRVLEVDNFSPPKTIGEVIGLIEKMHLEQEHEYFG